MKLELYRQIFEKYPNIRCHENPIFGSRLFPCGQTEMTKQTVTVRNFLNASKTV